MCKKVALTIKEKHLNKTWSGQSTICCPWDAALCMRSVCTEYRAWVLNWALSHLFLFACLNCDLYLFVQVQKDTKECSVQSFCPWDAALWVHRTPRVLSSDFPVFCLNALNSFECLNWQGLKTRANDKLSWRRTAVARQLCWASF